MRILIASDNYPPFIGGAHRQTELLARELLKRGHAVTVATVWHGGMPFERDEDGLMVYRLKQLATSIPALVKHNQQQHQPPFPDPVTILELKKILARAQPELVHAYGWFGYSVVAALRGSRIPLLLSARDYAYSCATRSLVYRDKEVCSGPALMKCLGCAGQHYGAPKGWIAALGVAASKPLLKDRVAGVHNVSTYVQEISDRDFLEIENYDAAHPAPIHAVIPSFQTESEANDTRSTTDLEPYLKQLPREPFILFVGAVRRVKGVEQLLEAYARLASPPPLVLIGTLEFDSPRAYPPNVKVLESFPHRAVMAAWDRCLFGVMPSLWPEPLGSVVYEGMSRGKAVIGSTPGGHADVIVDQESGLLVPQGDVDALERALRALLTDRELRERLGRAARTRSELFQARVAVPKFEALYRQVIAAARDWRGRPSALAGAE